MHRVPGPLAAALLAAALPALAQEPAPPPAPPPAAQEPVPAGAMAPLRLRSDTLRIVTPTPFLGAGRLAPRGADPEALARRWADSTLARIGDRAARRWRAAIAGDSTPEASPGIAFQPTVADDAPTGRQGGMQLLGQSADLGIQVNANIEMRFDRLKNLRCTASDVNTLGSSCRAGFTPPRVVPQMAVRTGGIVGQRIHVNVDYDTEREFDASNNIQVYYQGLEDEILQRVEVGNVTFTAPASRYITGGIPSNNFGVALQAQFGALALSGIYAQQKGNVVRARTFTVGDRTVQPVDRLAADRDFEPQRFFFVRDPRALPGYPAVDVLDLGLTGLPDSVRVTQVRVYRHRTSLNRPTAETNLSGIQAVALRRDSPQREGPINWEVLVEGRDYYLDPSALWFALAQRVDQDDLLAVSYVTARGDTVGTFPAAQTAGLVDTLELIYRPRTGPDVPTFYYEMRNAYRVGSIDDITRASVLVDMLVGGTQRPPTAPTFLAALGIAQSSDPSAFDEYNRLFPRSRDPGQGLPLREYFVVFPHLTPFADSTQPPQFRSDSLYRTPTYLLRTQGPAPLYQMALRYEAKGGDGRGSLMLGGFQIRQGSERVTVLGRTLVRNTDYTINYEVGQITFLNPDSLFAQPTAVSVQFEENAAFAVAPTNVFGLAARWDLGPNGAIHALALTQNQRSTFTRPPLGFEPASNMVAGVAGSFRFEPSRLTRLLDALPLVRTEAPSTLTLDAEFATSRPSPNQVGQAYVETFEGESGLFLPLGEHLWEYGSRPSSGHGMANTGIDPVLGFDDADAVALTWQNLIPSATNETVQLLPQQIDPSIRTQGSGQQAETVMWMTLQPDTVGGLVDPATFKVRWLLPPTPGPRWRSITLPLSSTGVDLSRVEYLEFWVLEDQSRASSRNGASLVFDFGNLYEDAVDFQPQRFSVPAPGDTVFSGRRRAGEGRLDTERDTLTGTFNAAFDDNGILGDVIDSLQNADDLSIVRDLAVCTSLLGQQLAVYSWGSLQNHCTRKNGQADAEDLNNDQHLDTLISATGEAHFRFVFPVGDPRYEVRTGGTVPGVGQWRLYRIPFRSDTVQVGLPDIRQVRALRMTVTAPMVAAESTLFFALARMRLVGAPWVKRAGSPIAGLSGERGLPHGEVVASVVSTENVDDLGYEPPPGVTDQGQSVGGGTQLGATQINEKSLRLLGTDVRPGERAEAYLRFPDGDRNFLGYRELRVWARGRGPGWDQRHLTFYVKVGQDENNFYLYRAPLGTTTWLPELVVDFQQWFALRAQIEQSFLSGQPPGGAAACGGDTLAYVACTGPYVVHVRNPTVAAPNLTRVQELAIGILRDSGQALDTAEVWVDDVRLSRVVDDPGYAGAVNLTLAAADVADLNLQLSRRDGDFRQLGEAPSYVGTTAYALSSTIRLERLGLERLGIAAPLTIRADRASQDPFFLNGTDVLASGLDGLRRPLTHSTSYALAVRRVRRGTRWWERAVVDNLGVNASWSSGGQRTELSDASSRIRDLRADYAVSPRDVNVRTLPGFLRGAIAALPSFLRTSEMFQGLRDSRLRLTPVAVSATTGLTRAEATRRSFRVPIGTSLDSAPEVRSLTQVLRSAVGMELRPFGSMLVGVNAAWDRDLRDYGDSTTVGLVAGASRQEVLGVDVGFLRQHTLNTRMAWTPPITSWFRPRFAWTSDYALGRDPNASVPEREQGDSAGAFRLPTTFVNGMGADLGAAIDLSRLWRGMFGDSAQLTRMLDRVTQFDVSRRIERRSQYDRPGFDPGVGYRLGVGGVGTFLSQEGRLANAAADMGQDRINVAVRAPLGVGLTGVYSLRQATVYSLRGTQHQTQHTAEEEWPSVTARWLWTPRTWVRKVVTAINVSMGWQERSSLSETPTLDAAGAALRFTQQTRARPLSVSLGWAPGIQTGFTRTTERSRADRGGNLTLGDRSSTGLDVAFSFRPPQEVLPIKSDIRTTARYLNSVNTLCVERAGFAGCIPVSDSHRDEYNLTMDTQFPPSLTAGLAVGYVVNDDRHVNRKFSQFSLTVSVRVFFSAGEVR